MTEINIEVNDLIKALSNQISSLNLDLHIARLQVSSLQNRIAELEENSSAKTVKPAVRD